MIPIILDSIAIIFLLATTALLFYIIFKYYKGMKIPPFWIYILGGFIVIAFRDIFSSLPIVLEETQLILGILRLLGYLLVFIGILELFRSYRARIKFDKPKRS